MPTRSEAIETDALEHWAFDEKSSARKELAAFANQMGVDLKDKETFQAALEVERLHHFPGSLEDAKRQVADYALEREHKLIDRLSFDDDPVHAEALAVAWTNVKAPGGYQINVTARQGATADEVAATVLALTGALRTLEEVGFTTVNTRR
jgi:hypothetical protein